MVTAGEIPRPHGQHAAALTPSLVITPFVSMPSPGQLVMTDMEIAEILAGAPDDFGEALIQTPASAASAGGDVLRSFKRYIVNRFHFTSR